ncbi:sialic acid-binding Ig-like lectin 14 [Garra rufa]|uniref:sialic acid-binding Ig-like lectin 14 n=1 Tax=Garra rufa TaxID=137080 RepID=UPI003CCE8429
MSVRMAPPLPLVFLLMIHSVSSADWGVSYSHSHICALKDSSLIMSCTYTYPTGQQIKKVFWTKNTIKVGEEHPDLSEDPEYSQRLQYLGDKQQNCTIRLSHVTLKDSHMYYFRFTTNVTDRKWLGHPGVTLTVTDLQVESPERVTEGDSVRLTCKSSCTLTDRATFIWYRNSQPLTERRDTNNQLLLQSVRREDAGRYSCALHGHTYISPAVYLSVMYPPRSVLVSIVQSGKIWGGGSVTLICSSDSNPPALNFSWFKEDESSAVGSGQSFSALQNGRFYCEAHNQHGSQRSDTVTVTFNGHLLILFISIGVVCGAAVMITMLLIWRRMKKINDTQQSQFKPHNGLGTKVFWTKNPIKGEEHPDLSKDPKYSQRLQVIWLWQNCTIRLSHVTHKDEHMYCFRFTTDKPDGTWLGHPGVSLTVTDLQVESPERVTEGDSVRLTYPPQHTFVAVSPCCKLVEGNPVTLSCSSDSNPPALNYTWFKGGTFVGSGRIYSISKISSDHSGEYKCKSINELGERDSDAVTLNVMSVGCPVILYISIAVVCGAVVVVIMVLIW